MGLFDWLGFGSAPSAPSDLERELVLSVASLLPEELEGRFRARLAAITHASRDGRHVSLEQRGADGQPLYPPETALSDYDGRQRLAMVDTLSLHSPSRVRAVIIMTRGNVSDIEFDHSPAEARADTVTEYRPRLLGPPFADPDLAQDHGDARSRA